MDVENLSAQTKTSMTVDETGLHLHKNQASTYEAILTDQELMFAPRGDYDNPVASFGVKGAYADKLMSYKTLSVGTENAGWYDFAVLPNGMADKWRSVEGVQNPFFIEQQPKNAQGDSAATLEIKVSGSNITYIWQYSLDGKTWTQVDGQSNDPNCEISLLSPGNVVKEYRCVVQRTIEGEDGNNTDETKISNSATIYCNSIPSVMIGREGNTLHAVLLNKSLATINFYQWYQLYEDSGWQAINGANNDSFSLPTGINTQSCKYKCVVGVYDGTISTNNRYNASESYDYIPQ